VARILSEEPEEIGKDDQLKGDKDDESDVFFAKWKVDSDRGYGFMPNGKSFGIGKVSLRDWIFVLAIE
jgi:hypothetical protein